MAVREILLLGNPQLYDKSEPVEKEELDTLKPVVDDLHDTLMDFRKRYGVGRAIALALVLPKIGISFSNLKRDEERQRKTKSWHRIRALNASPTLG